TPRCHTLCVTAAPTALAPVPMRCSVRTPPCPTLRVTTAPPPAASGLVPMRIRLGPPAYPTWRANGSSDAPGPDAVDLALGVIGRPHQGPRLHVGEAKSACRLSKLGELVWRVVAGHG